MQDLTLTAEGRLVYKEWQPAKNAHTPGFHVPKDVSAVAEQYLSEAINIAPDATLRSVFTLVLNSPILQAILARQCAREICLEGLADVAPTTRGIDPNDVEYVCVYRMMDRNSTEKTLSSLYCAFHGVGFEAAADVLSGGEVVYKKGDRPLYAFSFTSPQAIRDLPLKLDFEMTISEADFQLPNFWEKSENLTCVEFTLFEALDAIFDELSFHGGSEERDNALNGLDSLAALLKT